METSSKTTTGSAGVGACLAWRGVSGERCLRAWSGYLPKMPIIARLTMKSTMMMKTEETTTAWVVALPTP